VTKRVKVNQKALTRGRADYFSNILSSCDLNLRTWARQC